MRSPDFFSEKNVFNLRLMSFHTSSHSGTPSNRMSKTVASVAGRSRPEVRGPVHPQPARRPTGPGGAGVGRGRQGPDEALLGPGWNGVEWGGGGDLAQGLARPPAARSGEGPRLGAGAPPSLPPPSPLERREYRSGPTHGGASGTRGRRRPSLPSPWASPRPDARDQTLRRAWAGPRGGGRSGWSGCRASAAGTRLAGAPAPPARPRGRLLSPGGPTPPGPCARIP